MNIKRLTAILLLLLSLSLVLVSCNFSGMGSTSGGGNPEENPEESESPEGGDDIVEEKTLSYEEYINMTADAQEEFFYTFASVAEFKLWYKEAKAKYDAEHKPPEIDGDINLDDLIGSQE